MVEKKFEEVIDIIDEERHIKDGVRLQLDCVYCNRKPYRNFSDLVLPTLMGVGTMGGFRSIGEYKHNFDIKYVVLYSTGEDIYWQDYLDEENGLYTYYGDNQKPGKELHDTKLGGNLILRETFFLAKSNDFNERKKIPPFFLFEKTKSGDVKFSGLLVPGYKGIPNKEWLTALWAKRNEGGRFQNYKAIFTVVDTSSGSEFSPNDATIDLRWLDDLKNGNGYESKYAPINWKKWIMTGEYIPLIVNIESKTRTKEEQLPNDKKRLEMLKIIWNYFREKPTLFESFAITMVILADDNILDCKNTRAVRDGGRDGIGEYRIMKKTNSPIRTTFVVEAKCYAINESVGVKETSRLISRIKNRQFGVFVTTSYVAKQAYDEIIEDQHPIVIISGNDIIDILFANEITNCELLKQYLERNYPLDEKEDIYY